VAPHLAEIDADDAAGLGERPSERGRERERPSSPDPQSAGRRHEPGQFPMPILFPRAAMSQAYERLLRALQASPRRSVLVSGEAGVGKTTLARSLAAAMSKDGWRVFETSALEINAGMSFVGQLEGRVQALLQELRSQPQTLWLVRDFHQLLYAGRHNSNVTGVLEMLLPAIEAGELLLVGETRPASADQMLAEHPQLSRLIEVARLEPPRDEELEGIARAWVEQLPDDEASHVPDEVLEEAVTLARHHVTSLGMPAGVIRVLDRAREIAAADLVRTGLTPDHLLAAIAQLTGLPLDLLDERLALDTTALQAHFETRVMGQSEAVRVLVERLALMKAGITAPTRPYAVFLFAGPTGTGKTELVKALATWLFGSPERMIRVDMSELQDAGAFDRLLAASDLRGGGSLAARVRRQPFSVVLLDEFEKAHPQIWDLFLQVFDDGRLTDSRGDTVDFRNTFIVMTSNLGSKLQANERLGFVAGQGFSSREVERTVRQAFRPELLNRLDRIVVFQPLSRDAMREILKKQIREAFERRGLRRREWALEIEESAYEFLLQRGFTPDLGARPLQRSLEQYLLTPLARTIVERRAPEGDQFLFVRADGDRLAVEFVDPDDEAGAPAERPRERGRDLRAIAWEAHGDANELRVLADETAALEARLADEAWTARKAGLLAETRAPGFWQRDDRFEVLGRAEYLDRVEAGLRSARSLLSRLEGESRARSNYPRPLLRRLAQQLVLVGVAAGEALEHGPCDAFISIEPGPDAGPEAAQDAWLEQLLSMYEDWARARGMRVQRLEPVRTNGARGVHARWLAVSGFGALATLRPEEGLHLREDGPQGPGMQRTNARVRIAAQPPRPARGAEELARQAAEAFSAAGAPAAIVRRYRETPAPLVRDGVRGWRTGRIDRVWNGDFDLVPGGDPEGNGG
jgi:ATP-dependent Clp protease ATP-binding subunit ClpC